MKLLPHRNGQPPAGFTTVTLADGRGTITMPDSLTFDEINAVAAVFAQPQFGGRLEDLQADIDEAMHDAVSGPSRYRHVTLTWNDRHGPRRWLIERERAYDIDMRPVWTLRIQAFRRLVTFDIRHRRR